MQLAQIEAGRERDQRAFSFARTTLFTTAALFLAVLALIGFAAAFLFERGSEQAGLQVIWFGLGTLGGFGFGRFARPKQ